MCSAPEAVPGDEFLTLARADASRPFQTALDASLVRAGAGLGERRVVTTDAGRRCVDCSVARLTGELGATVGDFVTVPGPASVR